MNNLSKQQLKHNKTYKLIAILQKRNYNQHQICNKPKMNVRKELIKHKTTFKSELS